MLRDNSAIDADRFEKSSTFSFIYWLKPFTNEGKEDTGAPAETTDDELHKMPPTKAPKIQALSEIRTLIPPLVTGVLVGKAESIPGASIMEADDRQVTTFFTVQPSFHHTHSTNRV